MATIRGFTVRHLQTWTNPVTGVPYSWDRNPRFYLDPVADAVAIADANAKVSEGILDRDDLGIVNAQAPGPIGSVTPDTGAFTTLHLTSGASAALPTLGSTANTSMLIGSNSTYGLALGHDAASGDFWLQVMSWSSAAAYDLLLNPQGGNVGIGVANAANLLTVGGQATPVIQILPTTAVAAGMQIYGTSADMYINNTEAGAIIFLNAGVQKLRTDANTGSTGGTGSAGAGNQYVELQIAGQRFKLLHDGTL